MAVPSKARSLGDDGVSNHSIGIVSGEDINLRKSHETVANRKRFLPQHLQCFSKLGGWISEEADL